jgi:hypothetical protein
MPIDISDSLKSYLAPLQVRTLIGTMAGNRSDITEKQLTKSELQQVANTIKASRTYKETLLRLKENDNLNDWQKEEYNRFFPNKEAVAHFKSGAGSVQYDDYYNSDQGASDWNMAPSGAIRNTLGKFTYRTNEKGEIIVSDKYNFTGDKIEGLPNKVADTHRYEAMNIPEKIKTVAEETLYIPGVGVDPALGIRSLPSRVGNAFIGNKGRNVEIKLDKNYNVIPSEQAIESTRASLTGEDQVKEPSFGDTLKSFMGISE